LIKASLQLTENPGFPLDSHFHPLYIFYSFHIYSTLGPSKAAAPTHPGRTSINKKEYCMSKIKGSQAIIKCLQEEGVDLIFGYPGGAVIELYDESVQKRYPPYPGPP
jgi:hypothetical protein